MSVFTWVLRMIKREARGGPSGDTASDALLPLLALELRNEIGRLLVDAYENDPVLRVRGPLQDGTQAELVVFCGVLMYIMQSLLESRTIWKRNTELALNEAWNAISKWGIVHGASQADLNRSRVEVERVSLVVAPMIWAESTDAREVAIANFTEVQRGGSLDAGLVARVVTFLAEDGVVRTLLFEGDNDYTVREREVARLLAACA